MLHLCITTRDNHDVLANIIIIAKPHFIYNSTDIKARSHQAIDAINGTVRGWLRKELIIQLKLCFPIVSVNKLCNVRTIIAKCKCHDLNNNTIVHDVCVLLTDVFRCKELFYFSFSGFDLVFSEPSWVCVSDIRGSHQWTSA